jgi:hypothetical protein
MGSSFMASNHECDARAGSSLVRQDLRAFRTRRAISGTHKGQLCQQGMGHWPGGFHDVAGLG